MTDRLEEIKAIHETENSWVEPEDVSWLIQEIKELREELDEIDQLRDALSEIDLAMRGYDPTGLQVGGFPYIRKEKREGRDDYNWQSVTEFVDEILNGERSK